MVARDRILNVDPGFSAGPQLNARDRVVETPGGRGLNPHTGDSPTHWATVSVMAPSCALADALTKVFFMCPPHAVERLAKVWGVGVVLQDKRGEWNSHLQKTKLLG